MSIGNYFLVFANENSPFFLGDANVKKNIRYANKLKGNFLKEKEDGQITLSPSPKDSASSTS